MNQGKDIVRIIYDALTEKKGEPGGRGNSRGGRGAIRGCS